MSYLLDAPLKIKRIKGTRIKQFDRDNSYNSYNYSHKDKSSKQGAIRTCIPREAIVGKLIFRYYDGLAAGLHQAT